MSRTIDGTFGTRNADPILVRPHNFGTDAIERQRVSLGQSIIDADFEYGLQGTKWQTYQEVRKMPSFFEIPGTDLTVTTVTSGGQTPSTMTVQLTTVATGTNTLTFTTSGTTSTGTVTLGTAIAIPIGSYIVGLGGIAGPVYVSANTTAQSYTVTYRSQVATNLSAVSFGAVSNQPPSNGDVITVTGLANTNRSADRAEGFFLTTSPVSATGTLTYVAKEGLVSSGQVQTPYTVIRRGGIFNNGACKIYQSTVFQTLNTVVVNTSEINGLVPGTPICVTGTTGGVGANGNFFVDTTYTASQFGYTASGATAGTLNATIFTVILTIGLTTQGTLSSVSTTAMDATQLSAIGITGGGGTMVGSLSSIGASSAVLTITGGTTAAKTFGIAAASTAIQGTSTASTTGGSPFAPTSITIGLATNTSLANSQTMSNAQLQAILGVGIGGTATGTLSATSGSQTTITFTGTVGNITIAASGTAITTGAGTGTGTINGTSLNLTGTQALSAGTGSLLANQTVTTVRLNTIGITCGTSTATITAVSAPSVTLSITPAPTNTTFAFGTSGGNPLQALAAGTISGTIALRRVTIGLSAQGSLVDGFTMGSGGINQLGISGTGINLSTLSGTSASATTLTIAGMNTTDALSITQAGSDTSVIFSNQLAGTILIYVQPYATCVHRPFDGGVLMWPGQPSYASSVCRQSKKVFRYQSGKGLLWSSGTLFCPNNDIITVSAGGTAVGSLITVVCDVPHGAPQAGASIQLRGIRTSGYDGTYIINTVTESTTFTVLATRVLGATTAILAEQPRFIMDKWHGASVRAGCFEDQNGLFWEYDGITLWAVKRSSTFQVEGTVYTSANSQVLTGVNTRFTDQLRVGDRITIRGMTYTITSITSNTVLSFNPPYRGAASIASTAPVKACKIREVRVPQSLFNQDTVDGKGKSGYKIDLTKMQMIGLQYTWYGAGFVDFMVRGGDGNWVYAHRFTNNNVNDEAYMRTGNMPVRYEIANESLVAISRLSSAITNSDQTLQLEDDTTYWPPAGTVMIDQELISYAGKTSNTLTGCVRGTSLSYNVSDSTKTFSGAAAVAHLVSNTVNLVSCTCSPSLTHWGSAFIMDGQFDNDRGYFFNYSFNQGSITSGTTIQLFFLRLAPSVSNGIVGDIGNRDLLNRAQLLLQQLDVAPYGGTAGGTVNVTGILNPSGFESSTFNWLSVNSTVNGSQPSFCQVATMPPTGTYVAGSGERVFSTLAQSGSMNSLNLSALKELSNALLGGNRMFPDGPDTLMIQITALNQNMNNCVLNLYWSEAQA